MPSQTIHSPETKMMQMITGFWISCCIYTAARLDLADCLKDRPKDAGMLARETGTHEPSLRRLLDVLCGVEILHENEKGQFELTSLGHQLREDIPGSMKAIALMNLGDHYPAWGNLLHSIKTGETAFDDTFKMSIWDYYEKHPSDGLNFNKAMAGLTENALANVLPAYDFSPFPVIIDVGGGNGALLCGILQQTPGSKGIVFDSEVYLKSQALDYIALKNLQMRCSFQGGSFFDTIPEGGSAYLMKSILHDWNDEKALEILVNLHTAMSTGSKLLLIESVVPGKNVNHPAKFMDINMMVMTGGKERSETEWRALIGQSGLQFLQIIPTQSPMLSILVAEKK